MLALEESYHLPIKELTYSGWRRWKNMALNTAEVEMKSETL